MSNIKDAVKLFLIQLDYFNSVRQDDPFYKITKAGMAKNSVQLKKELTKFISELKKAQND